MVKVEYGTMRKEGTGWRLSTGHGSALIENAASSAAALNQIAPLGWKYDSDFPDGRVKVRREI
ncbi:MAG: hypothetical protein PVI21_03185 [Candidatus Woesebacteria bacterium]|jgi:hypothetical protein